MGRTFGTILYRLLARGDELESRVHGFLTRDRRQQKRNRNPGAAKTNHAHPPGNVPAVAK
jgi:hypothetical protein